MPELYQCVADVVKLILDKDLGRKKFKVSELLNSGGVNLFNDRKRLYFQNYAYECLIQ